jgi:hypothetical protein
MYLLPDHTYGVFEITFTTYEARPVERVLNLVSGPQTPASFSQPYHNKHVYGVEEAK